MASKDLSKEEEFVSSEGGARDAPAVTERASEGGDPSKMENDLEINKANKPTLDSSEDVAGRKEKGTGTKILEKMTGRAGDKAGEKGEAAEKASGRHL